MPTSVGDLLVAAEEAAVDSRRTSFDVAAAAAGLGHAARALDTLRSDGITRVPGDHRDQQIRRLASRCAQLARIAPIAESRLTQLMAATADAVGLRGRRNTVEQNWAVAVAVTDAMGAIAVILGNPTVGSDTVTRITQIAMDIRRVQQSAALDPPTRSANAALDHPIPSYLSDNQVSSANESLAEAIAMLVHRTHNIAQPLTVAEVLAITLAAEKLSQRAAGPKPAGQQPHPGNMGAAHGWAAVDAALAPFHDGSRRHHLYRPDFIKAATSVHRIAQEPNTSASALAEAIQHLPALAENIRQTVQRWPTGMPVVARVSQLTYRQNRAEISGAKRAVDPLVRVDALDLVPVTDALSSAGILSRAVADRFGDGTPPRARRTWVAHHEQTHTVEGPTQIRQAQAQAYLRLRQQAEVRSRPAHPR